MWDWKIALPLRPDVTLANTLVGLALLGVALTVLHVGNRRDWW